ncbi:monocarboxylate transporter 9-like [Musca domestica]|uniref:Monocarboxylate transporter 9-like n=1 Tax=Musca domestica TaxID=7370 RepID=A0ABM3VJ27_MUSDO|nr:monocarboxylate transporter 9-like [Musca domestica]
MSEDKSKLNVTNNNNNNNTSVIYKQTTKPKKSKHRDKSNLGPNFVAPDGGWGWVVCIATGLSNLSLFPPHQQYGLIYRQRLENFGFDVKEITTIINSEFAISSLVGLINGAMFRRFSFRQVAMLRTLMAFTGIFFSAFCENFLEYFVCFSTIYGFGLGLSKSANSLAVNTYFKNRRRRATGFALTITGLGSVVFPQIAILLLSHYGAQDSILIFAALMLNAFMCSLTLQPVLWHSTTKTTEEETVEDTNTSAKEDINFKCKYCQNKEREKDMELDVGEYEITEPCGTPLIARSNDGWFGSKLSLNKEARYYRTRQISESGGGYGMEENRDKCFPKIASKASIYSKADREFLPSCTCAEEKLLLEKNFENTKKGQEAKQPHPNSKEQEHEKENAERERLSLCQKIVLFFDLDLLRDFTFVNLAVGMAIMMFGEINFSVLTPFILNSFGYNDRQISLAMSLLSGMDIIVRFFGPFALEKVKLSNSVLFAIGILIVMIGRLLVTLTNSFEVVLMLFVVIGFGKGFRMLFAPLIVPSYVPLNRLPAASGLQLIITSITSFTLGPLLGSITDKFGYAVTIHCMNALTCLMLLFWLLEYLIRSRRPNMKINR